MLATTGIDIALFLLWILLASTVAWLLYYFKSLSRDVNKGNLIRIIDRVIEKEIINEKNIERFRKDLENFKKESLSDVRSVGLVKFNPFNELGGEHSFSLTMLNGEGNGFILTNLHARDRTRVYIKNIKKGKSKTKLSNEEEKSLDLAVRSR